MPAERAPGLSPAERVASEERMRARINGQGVLLQFPAGRPGFPAVTGGTSRVTLFARLCVQGLCSDDQMFHSILEEQSSSSILASTYDCL